MENSVDPGQMASLEGNMNKKSHLIRYQDFMNLFVRLLFVFSSTVYARFIVCMFFVCFSYHFHIGCAQIIHSGT